MATDGLTRFNFSFAAGLRELFALPALPAATEPPAVGIISTYCDTAEPGEGSAAAVPGTAASPLSTSVARASVRVQVPSTALKLTEVRLATVESETRSRLGGLRVPAAGVLVSILVAVAVFAVAFDDGGYGIPARGSIAIAAWWGVILAVGLRVRRGEPLPWVSVAVGALLAGLALWSLASIQWSSSSEAVVAEFNRVSLLLGIFVLVLLVTRQGSAARFVDGLLDWHRLGRCPRVAQPAFLRLFPDRGLTTLLPSAATRLSYPVGYWNGLGVLVGLGVPLLLRSSLVSRSTLTRAAAVGFVPICTATIYLTSSRGGMGVAAISAIAFVILTTDRWAAAAALVVALAGSIAVILVLDSRGALVNGPLESDLAGSQGRTAAILIALCCIGTSAVHLAGARALGARPRPGRAAGLVTAALLVLIVTIGGIASQPARRLDTFKAMPSSGSATSQSDFVSAHLTSGTAVAAGNSGHLPSTNGGRTVCSEAAPAPMSSGGLSTDLSPLFPEGCALSLSGAAWGAGASRTPSHRLDPGLGRRYRSVSRVSIRWGRSRHGGSLDVGARRVRHCCKHRLGMGTDGGLWMRHGRIRPHHRLGNPGCNAGTYVGGGASASGALPDVGKCGNGLLRSAGEGAPPARCEAGFLLGGAMVLIAVLAMLAQAPPLLGDLAVEQSQSAAIAGDSDVALSRALDARRLQPWAASPYTQLALVDERRGDLRRARAWIDMAIRRDEKDWRLWLIASRLETKLGQPASAQRRLQRAASLNPRAPLFAGVKH